MKLEIVLVLCCLALAHSLKIVNQNTAGTLACCGSGNTFDTTTQICCINTVFTIPSSSSNQQAACCGTSLLNNDQICCPANAGFVSTSDRAIANTLQCCGTKGYDPSTQLCCDNGSIVSSSSGALQCCGSRGYNPATDLCCGTSVISNGATNGQTCCGSAGFNSATQLCCFNKVVSNTNNNLQCCDATQFSTAFDPSTQTCCAGVVNTGASATCCGTRVFTAATQLCCAGNTIVSNPNANLECCGSSSYNPATQTCCSVTTETVSTGAKDCAGCKTITTTTSIQTQVGSIASSVGLCCGLTAYDSTINQCCSGRVNPLSTAAGTRTCCGTTTFNAAADLCCGSASSALPIVGGQSLANTECCGTSTFNTQTQTCQCGKQVAMTADIAFLGGEEACCGTTQYNNVSATCCSSSFGNFLYPLEPAAGFKCCPQDGKSLYNPGYQICCDTKTVCSSTPAKLTIRDVEEVSFDFRALKGQFNPRDSHNFDSLLEKHASATRDVEEIEEVEDLEKKKKKKKKKHSSGGKSNKADSRDRTSGNIANNDKGKFPLVQCGDACCNGQGYFINYQKCCGTPYTGYNVIDVSNTDAASSPLACCGDNIYNTNHQSCCEEIKSIDSCNVATANYGIFDPAVQLCCTA